MYELWIEGSGLSCCNNTNCSFQYEVVVDIKESVQPHIHHKISTLSITVYSYTILTLSIGVTLTGYCTKCTDKDTHEVDKLYHRLCSACSLWLHWSDYKVVCFPSKNVLKQAILGNYELLAIGYCHLIVEDTCTQINKYLT